MSRLASDSKVRGIFVPQEISKATANIQFYFEHP